MKMDFHILSTTVVARKRSGHHTFDDSRLPCLARSCRAKCSCCSPVGWARDVDATDVPGRAGGVNALAIDPHTPATLYAVTECAGVLKSTDGGDTWIVANTGLPNMPDPASSSIPSRPARSMRRRSTTG